MINWDAHTCLPQHPQADFTPVQRLHSAGVNYVSLNVGADMNPIAQIMSVIAGYRATIAANPDRYALVASVDDIIQAAADGRIAISFDLEGALPLLEQPEMIPLYAQLGVRQMHFAYNRNNSVADGCHDLPRGLTPLGHSMVAAVNDAGILMDCSHTGRLCSLDIMSASSQPVIFSHANPYTLVPHAGIGLDICFTQPELDDTPPGAFDPSYWWPASAGYSADRAPTFTPPEVWRQLPAALRKVGLNDNEAELVLGRNMMRVAQQ